MTRRIGLNNNSIELIIRSDRKTDNHAGATAAR